MITPKLNQQIRSLLFLVSLSLLACTTLSVQAIEIGSYYTGWSAEDGFRLKQVALAGLADKLTFLNYAFENVYKMPDGSYRCASGNDIEDHTDGLGMRASLDYANHFTAEESVDGSADHDGQALAGNFNQIRQLKAHYPQLKVMLALGGGEWSRWFSAAAATPASRRTLVASCLDLYIKGNLPQFKNHGGPGAAAGLFDGIDMDWEHPGLHGAPYNTVSPKDKQNFTLLLAEFRKQLNAIGRQDGKRYYLTAAINSTAQHMAHTEPARYSQYLDWINLMNYDFHGAWKKTGPTDFQSNLYSDPNSPDPAAPSVDKGIQRFVSAGVAPQKIVLGIPFYARGWSGVAAENHGLYQPALDPAKGFEAGAERYSNIVTRPAARFYHPVTRQLWTYDDGTFWTYDDPLVIHEKVDYVRQHQLGGMMSWSLDQDDANFTLSNAMAELR